MAEQIDKKTKNRELIIALFFSLFFMVIGIRAVQLQVFERNWLADKAENQYLKSVTTGGKRGTIFDIKKREMAVSLDAFSIGVVPSRLKEKKVAAGMIAKALGLRKKEVLKKISGKSFKWLKRKATPEEARTIKSLELKGIELVKEHERFYPGRSLAAQVLGFTSIDGRGLEGIEYAYNDVLKGTKNRVTVSRDARGKSFTVPETEASKGNGDNLILTLDRTIQFATEKALNEAATQFRAKYGLAVVMNPKTGAILAMANYPAFNPNAFGDFDRTTFRNRAVIDAFEPGSTMKVFSAAAALEAKACTPNSIFFCENGTYRVGGHNVNDTHPHQWLSLQQIIKFSSNIGVVKISELIGKKRLYNTLTDFGFGKKTGLDLSGETTGLLMPSSKWTTVDTGAISFGQGISVSAVQLVTALSAIANGGFMVKPHTVHAITDPSGTIKRTFDAGKKRRIISEKTARAVKKMMATVVTEGGTGVNAALEGYTVCGKTGTAQKIGADGRYSKKRYSASFLGFAPEKNPEIAVLVVIDEPRGNYYGGTVAAPAFKQIVFQTLNYLKVAPENQSIPEKLMLAGIKRGEGETVRDHKRF